MCKIEKILNVPTWRGNMAILIAVLEDGTPEGRAMARDELLRLAEKLDAHNMEIAA